MRKHEARRIKTLAAIAWEQEQELYAWETKARELIRKRDVLKAYWNRKGFHHDWEKFATNAIEILNIQIEAILTMTTNARDDGTIRRIV